MKPSRTGYGVVMLAIWLAVLLYVQRASGMREWRSAAPIQVATAMNMLGNLGGFVAPAVGGMILPMGWHWSQGIESAD